MNVLVVAGHPADMFDHCGGTLAHHIKNGDNVTCVTLTQGLRVHDEVIYDLFRTGEGMKMPEEERKKLIDERLKVKYSEVIEACGLFGITDIRFLEYDDEVLTVTPGMISKLAQVIREVRPHLIITHWPYQGDTFGNHHAVTAQITLHAICAAHGINFETGTPSWNVAQVAYMICPADYVCTHASQKGRTAYPNYFVDVTDMAETKVKALQKMHSQKYDVPGYAQKTTELWSGNLGQSIRTSYAEGFVIEYPELGNTIPISDHRMWLTYGDEKEILAAISDLRASRVPDVEQ